MTTCTRGSGSSEFDYADYMEKYLGASTALILCDYFKDASYQPTVDRMRARFGVRVLEAAMPHRKWQGTALQEALLRHNVTHLHVQIGGAPWQNRFELGRLAGLKSTHLAVHAMFHGSHPYGNAFAKLDDTIDGANTAVVPYLATPLSGADSKAGSEIRRGHGIRAADTVVCGYGGQTSFDIAFARETVCSLGGSSDSAGPNLYFLFANFPKFCSNASSRVFFLPALATQAVKHGFVQACDAMLHARASGETFGLAVAEFNMMSRPVLTWNKSRGRAHINILGDEALLYSNASDLRSHLLDVASMKSRHHHRQARPAYEGYLPGPVMLRFCHVFFSGQDYARAYAPEAYVDGSCARSSLSGQLIQPRRQLAEQLPALYQPNESVSTVAAHPPAEMMAMSSHRSTSK